MLALLVEVKAVTEVVEVMADTVVVEEVIAAEADMEVVVIVLVQLYFGFALKFSFLTSEFVYK